jgi:hypothetical protein
VAFAAPHTFFVYGHVQYDNGSSIPGTTIRLLEPVNNTPPIVEGSFSYVEPAVQSTVTDNNGNFQFINVTTNYSTLGLDLEYPPAHPANPQLVYIASDIVPVNTSGVQHINITRWSTQNPEPNSIYPLQNLNDDTPSQAALITIIIFGLVGLFIIRQKKKS